MAKNLLDGWIEVFKAGKHIDSGGFSIQLWDLKVPKAARVRVRKIVLASNCGI